MNSLKVLGSKRHVRARVLTKISEDKFKEHAWTSVVEELVKIIETSIPQVSVKAQRSQWDSGMKDLHAIIRLGDTSHPNIIGEGVRLEVQVAAPGQFKKLIWDSGLKNNKVVVKQSWGFTIGPVPPEAKEAFEEQGIAWGYEVRWVDEGKAVVRKSEEGQGTVSDMTKIKIQVRTSAQGVSAMLKTLKPLAKIIPFGGSSN